MHYLGFAFALPGLPNPPTPFPAREGGVKRFNLICSNAKVSPFPRKGVGGVGNLVEGKNPF